MSRPRRRALVVVRDGPASERGWLALRTALALGLGGLDVTVWLDGDAAAFAQPRLDARAWLGGDPAAEVAGLLDDLDAAVHVDALAAGPLAPSMRPGIRASAGAELWRLYAAADVVVAS